MHGTGASRPVAREHREFSTASKTLQEHAGSVRIADAENKAAAIKLEKDSLTRARASSRIHTSLKVMHVTQALPAERERHLLQLGRRRRELELEATSELSRFLRPALQLHPTGHPRDL